MMVDINRWYNCKKEKPRKKGKYGLMIGKRGFSGNWLNIQVVVGSWNGHTWGLSDDIIPVKWSYMKSTDAYKYPTMSIGEMTI